MPPRFGIDSNNTDVKVTAGEDGRDWHQQVVKLRDEFLALQRKMNQVSRLWTLSWLQDSFDGDWNIRRLAWLSFTCYIKHPPDLTHHARPKSYSFIRLHMNRYKSKHPHPSSRRCYEYAIVRFHQIEENHWLPNPNIRTPWFYVVCLFFFAWYKSDQKHSEKTQKNAKMVLRILY